MKRLSKIMTLILVALILTGCVRKKVTMKIKKNGSIEVSAIDAYSSSAGESLPESEKELYKKNGFKVEDYEADDYKGVKVSKKYKISEVSSDSAVTFAVNDLNTTANPKMFQKTGKNKYKANMVLDASEYSGSGADISYSVTLPSKPTSHNADKVEGNTLTWTIDLGQKKDINFEFSLTGGNSVLWIILGIVGVAAIAIVVVVVLNNKNKNGGNGLVNGMQPQVPTTQPTMNPTENGNVVANPMATPVETPVTETPAEMPVVEQTPAVEVAAVEAPVVETPVADIPAEMPVVEQTPAVEVAAVETPMVETPVTETPAEMPVVEQTPAVEVAPVETPVVETPVIEETPMSATVEETVGAELTNTEVSLEKQSSEM